MGVAPATGEFVERTPDAPPPDSGVQSSGPPGRFGGNLDVRDLTIGSTLYLPVSQPGGQFFTGDGHAGMGNGEVSGNAAEQGMSTPQAFSLASTAADLEIAEVVDAPRWSSERSPSASPGGPHADAVWNRRGGKSCMRPSA